MVSILRQVLVVVACLALIVVPQCFASGISSAGVSLGAANTWSGVQTFPADGVKITDASGDILTLSAGVQSGNYKLSAPTLGADDTYVAAALGGQYITGYKLWNNGTLYLMDTPGYATSIRCDDQTGSYQLAIPPLLANDKFMTRGVPGTITDNVVIGTAGKGIQIKTGSNSRLQEITLSAGTLSQANTSVTASTKLFLQRKSGTAAEFGHLTYTISAGVGYVVNSTDAQDDSVVEVLLVEPAP